jgi:hypothetical protein
MKRKRDELYPSRTRQRLDRTQEALTRQAALATFRPHRVRDQIIARQERASQRAFPTRSITTYDDIPTWAVSTFPEEGPPRFVDITPVRFVEEGFMVSLVSRIRLYVLKAVKRYNKKSNDWNLQRVKVQINCENIESGKTGGLPRYVYLRDVNPALILELFAVVVQSNDNAELRDFKWSIGIQKSTIVVGGFGGVIPKWVKTFKLTWQAHEHQGQKVGCAAVALQFAMKKKSYDESRKELLAKEAFELQTSFGWADEITISQLQDFVDKFREYQIVVFSNNYAESFENDGWTKRIFLYYDVENQHYAYTKHPSIYYRFVNVY